MYIICELCYSKNAHWAAGNHEKFIEHLLSSDHQKNAMLKFEYAWENSSFQELFSIEDEDRCVVVRGSTSLDEMEDQKSLLKSFSKFGILHDYVLLKRWPKFICAIIFDSKEEVKNVMHHYKTTKTGKEIICTPWRSDDWVLLRSEIQMPEPERNRNSFPRMSELCDYYGAPLANVGPSNNSPFIAYKNNVSKTPSPPIPPMRNPKANSQAQERKIPKYRDPDVKVRLANELNGMLCVAYPFLSFKDHGKIVLLTPSKIFKQVFMQFFSGFASKPMLKKLLLYIWVNFAQDFVADYLTSCYFFRTQEKVLPDCEKTLSDISYFSNNIQSRKRRAHNSDRRSKHFRSGIEENGHSSSESEEEVDEISLCGDNHEDAVDFDGSELQQDLDELESVPDVRGQHMQAKMETILEAYNNWGETVIRRLYTCECTEPVWDNRDVLRMQLMKTQSQSTTPVTHPLTLETTLSNLVKESNRRPQMSASNKFRQCMRLFLAYKIFVWKERFSQGTEGTLRVPVFLIILRSDMDRFSQTNLNHLTHSIHKVFADYSKYRLKRWICG